ncbi:hypothetical protein NPIL_580821 [Nephila pilipes]|uniref:Uncharacterized protein n=1 Tax=Nephila pilipes TaxID=299642 RepID=A0A8X6UNK3_NEPPI|nr:hypothetical protein NPIL_580821 [Nephila pilipes]
MSIKAIAGFICVCMMITLVINIESTKAAPFMGGHHGGGGGGVLPILAAGAVGSTDASIDIAVVEAQKIMEQISVFYQEYSDINFSMSKDLADSYNE